MYDFINNKNNINLEYFNDIKYFFYILIIKYGGNLY